MPAPKKRCPMPKALALMESNLVVDLIRAGSHLAASCFHFPLQGGERGAPRKNPGPPVELAAKLIC